MFDYFQPRNIFSAKAKNLDGQDETPSKAFEAQGNIEQLNAKLGQIEKAKAKLQADIDDMAAQADQNHILNSSKVLKAK